MDHGSRAFFVWGGGQGPRLTGVFVVIAIDFWSGGRGRAVGKER
jgi:hypothetical protein